MPCKDGGQRIRLELEFEFPKGRRAGFVTAGIGAWLVMVPTLSKKSSWKMVKGSSEPGRRACLAIVASTLGVEFEFKELGRKSVAEPNQVLMKVLSSEAGHVM